MNYTRMGDKKNSDFFEEYLPRVYERRMSAGLDDVVGEMAAAVVQVSHGDAINYLAVCRASGPTASNARYSRTRTRSISSSHSRSTRA